MKPSLLVVDPAALELILTATAKIGFSTDRIVLVNFSSPPMPTGTNFLTLEDLMHLGHSKRTEYQFAEYILQSGEGKIKTALYFPSSGTTGFPKMVAIPHSAFIANI